MGRGKSSKGGLMLVLLSAIILSSWIPTQSIILTCTKLEYYGKEPYVMWQREGEPRRYLGNGPKIFRGPNEKKYRMDTWLGTIRTIQDKSATHYVIPFIPPLMAGKIWCMADRFRMRTPVTLEPTPKGKRSLGQKGVNSNFAYNCSEGKTVKIGPASRANQILQVKGVMRVHIGDPYNKPQVILGEDIYNVSCEKVQITYTGNEGKCYADDAQAVYISAKKYNSFRDRLGYLVQNPARIECHQKDNHNKVLGKIRRETEEIHASQKINQAIIGAAFADLSVIFNQQAAYSMVVLSELCLCSMNSMSGISDLYVLYRKYAALGTLVLSLAYLIWTGSLFAVALCHRITPGHALRLIFPSYRRWRELITLKKDTIRKEEERKRIEDRLMKNLPVYEFDDMAGNHFQEIYKNLHSLNKKFKILEDKLSQQKGAPFPSKTKGIKSALKSYLSAPALSKETTPRKTKEETTAEKSKEMDNREEMVEIHQEPTPDTETVKIETNTLQTKGTYNIREASKARQVKEGPYETSKSREAKARAMWKKHVPKEPENRKPETVAKPARKRINTTWPPTVQEEDSP